jgi:uncharacterized phiE125 gp8 family phage protein
MKFVDLSVVTAPAGLPVTAQEFTDHARLNGITVANQPELLERELTAATQRAEQYLRRSLITQTLSALYAPEDSAAALMIALPRGKVQSVSSVTSAGAPVAGYTYEWNLITLAEPLTAPAVVEWISGFGDTGDDVPDQIREGILQYATVLYEGRTGDREAKYQASAGRTLPAGVVDLWRPFQVEISG